MEEIENKLAILTEEADRIRAESNGNRVQWPASFRNRALELHSQGFSFQKIGIALKLHGGTVARWKTPAKKSEGSKSFSELKVLSSRELKTSDLRVITREGSEILGLGVEDLAHFFKMGIL